MLSGGSVYVRFARNRATGRGGLPQRRRGIAPSDKGHSGWSDTVGDSLVLSSADRFVVSRIVNLFTERGSYFWPSWLARRSIIRDEI